MAGAESSVGASDFGVSAANPAIVPGDAGEGNAGAGRAAAGLLKGGGGGRGGGGGEDKLCSNPGGADM